MYKVIEWKDIVDESNGKKVRKDSVRLSIDCIYKNKAYAQNYANEVFPVLIPGAGMSGGFRYNGKISNQTVKYVVLFSTNNDIYWQDEIDEEHGICIYYGDNQTPGRDLHNPDGNQILRYVFDMATSNSIDERKKIPPFFLFERDNIGGVKFRGLLVPGYQTLDQREWLSAIWAKRDEGGRFQNYKAVFTILDTSSGSEFEPNEASINLKWLDDLRDGKGIDSIYTPKAFKEWVVNKKYNPLITYIRPRTRTQEEQLPSKQEDIDMLNHIKNYFKNPADFEPMAIMLAIKADDNILTPPTRTRAVKDGGRDGIGNYIIMRHLNEPLKTTFAIEAKCYSLNDSVGVKETSRLISRIRYRQFGVLVTTSFVSKQAYDEIIEDEQPIAIIAGKDIIDILYKMQITNINLLDDFLKENFPNNLTES